MFETNLTSKSVILYRVKGSTSTYSLPMQYGAGFYYGVGKTADPFPQLTELDVKAGFRIGCDAE